MTPRFSPRAHLAMLGLAAWFTCPSPVALGAEDDFWKAHVEPLLKERCFECHNATKSKSGLDLTSLQPILKGGDRGAAVIPGRPSDSNLYTFLAAGADPHMPPKRQLTDEQSGLIKTWIEKLGAKQTRPDANAASLSTNTHLPKSIAKAKPVWTPPAKMPASQVIDRFIELGWKARGAEPARLADDATFLRRVFLDLHGRIPTPDEVRVFGMDRSKARRTHVVDMLLDNPAHARHLREIYDVVLMGRRGADFENQRLNNQWYDFLETSFRENRPWNQVVNELIQARPASKERRGATWFLYERHNNPQAMAEAVAPIVFGVQIKCAQCHDHMVAREIKQAHYWGMVAAFNRSKNVDTPNGPGLSESAIGGFSSFANLKKESQPAFLTFFNGRRVDEPWPKEGEKEVDAPENYVVPPPKEKERPTSPAVPKFSRREALANAVTENNPLLARAQVNRIWALLMGRGIVHPVDLMDSKHPASHPELLDWLAKDFESSGFDTRRLIRNIVLTKAYQLDSRAPAKPKATKARKNAPEPPLGESFARSIEKPLSAEQLFHSLVVATGNKPEATGKIAGREETQLRRAFVKEFPDLFAPEYNASLQQALFMANSPIFDTLLEPRDGNLAARLAALTQPEEQVREAFLAVYGRKPDTEEQKAAVAFLNSATSPNKPKQLLWALLTSTEFQVNH